MTTPQGINGTQTRLVYAIPDALDVLKLGQLVELWHTLTCSGMPGSEIEQLTYSRVDGALVVVFQ